MAVSVLLSESEVMPVIQFTFHIFGYYTRGHKYLQNYCTGFFSPCEAEDAALLTQGKDDNEAGWKKDKQETANIYDREYMFRYG
ncbi:MAG: hypothetical protein FWC13_05555 [Oscillospiraceae bacterium]|nr:hypothetical protein [Oscillospiraceae bacterium]